MAREWPSILAGHSMVCPHEKHPALQRMRGYQPITPPARLSKWKAQRVYAGSRTRQTRCIEDAGSVGCARPRSKSEIAVKIDSDHEARMKIGATIKSDPWDQL